MLRVQKAMGGGVLNPIVEHAGDLTHRMSEDFNFKKGQFKIIEEKVDRVIKYLSSGYGFEKEMKENIKNNAKAKEMSTEEYKEKIDKALEEYAQAHRKVPVYNQVQWQVKRAAINIGEKDFERAEKLLKKLKNKLNSEEEWISYASQYKLDENNNPIQYEPV